MKAGDRVKLVGIPPDVHDDDESQTKTLFQKCLGTIFVVEGMEAVEGVPFELARLDVGHVLGEKSFTHTIWVEPEYLEAQNDD